MLLLHEEKSKLRGSKSISKEMEEETFNSIYVGSFFFPFFIDRIAQTLTSSRFSHTLGFYVRGIENAKPIWNL